LNDINIKFIPEEISISPIGERMHYLSLLMLVTLLLNSTVILAEDQANKLPPNSGFQSIQNKTLNSLNINGAVELRNTNITGMAEINGSIEALNAQIGQLQVRGAARLKKCVVNGTTVIHGHLYAEETTFKKELSVFAQNLTLNACNVDSILFNYDEKATRQQMLVLSNGTIVTKDVTFEGGKGSIVLSNESKIQGTVAGATVTVASSE
jgi:hypothetical protein